MPFIPVADTAKAALKFTQYGQQLVNTLWFHKVGGWTATDLNDLCIALNSWVTAEMLPSQQGSVTYNGAEAVDMSAAGQEGVVVPVTTGNEGHLGGTSLPSNVTAAIKFLTGFTGRSNRGRNFFVGLAAASVAGDELTSGSQAALVHIYNQLGTYLVDLAASHVVASLYSGVDGAGKPIPRSAGIVHAVTTYTMDIFLDSMRRRLEGRGN